MAGRMARIGDGGTAGTGGLSGAGVMRPKRIILPGEVRPARGMNALSVSEITGIPRESARRKLQLLAANGYLHRDEEGLFPLGDRYRLDAFFSELKPLFWDAMRLPR